MQNDSLRSLSNLNRKLFETALSTSDVLLKPSMGVLDSRSKADVNLHSPIIYNSPMDMVSNQSLFDMMHSHGQASVSCRFASDASRLNEVKLNYNKSSYWFTVGASEKDYILAEKASRLFNTRLNICVDVAHGCTTHMLKIYRKYKESIWCRNLMSGTVATSETAKLVHLAGCSHIRVGIGPGSACSTRVVTGCGVPNLSAVFDIWDYFYGNHWEAEPPVIIADGGIKTTGDIAKYLSAGADAVMIGNLLSRTYESGGWKTNPFYSLIYKLLKIKKFRRLSLSKRYRGQASSIFQLERRGSVSGSPEGVQGAKMHPSYTCEEFLQNVFSSLSSTISYLGLKSLLELSPETVQFIQVTPNSLNETNPNPNF